LHRIAQAMRSEMDKSSLLFSDVESRSIGGEEGPPHTLRQGSLSPDDLVRLRRTPDNCKVGGIHVSARPVARALKLKRIGLVLGRRGREE
jgi:hypothetical protein